MKKIGIVVVLLIALFTSCEWINMPVESMIVEIENLHEYQLENVEVLVRLQGDLEDVTADFGIIQANGKSELEFTIEDKFFDTFQVSLGYTTVTNDGSGGTVNVTRSLTEASPLVDPVDAVEYHSFRALARSNFRILIQVDSFPRNGSSLELMDNTLWMGYELLEE